MQTSLASRAIDALSDSPSLPSAPASAAPKEKNRAEVCEALLKYLDTDTICFHEEQPWRLVKMQEERWLPIIDWVKEEYKCDGESSPHFARRPPPSCRADHPSLDILVSSSPNLRRSFRKGSPG